MRWDSPDSRRGPNEADPLRKSPPHRRAFLCPHSEEGSTMDSHWRIATAMLLYLFAGYVGYAVDTHTGLVLAVVGVTVATMLAVWWE